LRVLIVVGVRPQFVKLGPLLPHIARDHDVTVVHTGQHWDDALADEILRDFELAPPDIHLRVREDERLRRIALTISGLTPVLEASDRPDLVLLIGDSDPAFAGAVATATTTIPIAHAEAGLRSLNYRQAEERNRLCIDAVAALHFAPTVRCQAHLFRENHPAAVMTGDLHLDAVRKATVKAEALVCRSFGRGSGDYALVTVHRPDNLRPVEQLRELIEQVATLSLPCIWPMHPGAWRAIGEAGLASQLTANPRVSLVGPQSYPDLLSLAMSSRAVITDSGGLQREAFYLGKPCLVLRDETEFPETIEAGYAVLAPVGAEPLEQQLRLLLETCPDMPPDTTAFGDGDAAHQILASLNAFEAAGRPVPVPRTLPLLENA
jgi:UDP-N-acetylglucosamine 2-epimerase